MVEIAQSPAVPFGALDLQVRFVAGGKVLRMKSWLPQHANGNEPVAIAERELPSRVGAALPGPARVLCIGPGDWIIPAGEDEVAAFRAQVEPAASTFGLVLFDLTDSLARLEVRGFSAREFLSKGCGLDMSPRAFPAGSCARTRFAQIPVLIDSPDQSDRFELYVARSYAHYLHSWLVDAMDGSS